MVAWLDHNWPSVGKGLLDPAGRPFLQPRQPDPGLLGLMWKQVATWAEVDKVSILLSHAVFKQILKR